MDHKYSHIINHLGEDRERYFNAVAPPIMQTSNFKFESMAEMEKAFESERSHHLYTRGNNPTVSILSQKIAALQGTEDAIVTGSGASAITCGVMPFVQAGDHIVAVENIYTWAKHLFDDILKKFGVEVTYVDGRNTDSLLAAVQENTKMIYLESPTSLMMELQDIHAIGAFAKSKNILTAIDATYLGIHNPACIEAEMDIIIHTASKYIGGHSDVIAGVICGTKEIIDQIFSPTYMTFGPSVSPFDAWLLIRGLRTMEMRIRHTASSSKEIIDFLSDHPKVDKILHPFHESHPQHTLAKRQMDKMMPLFSIVFTEVEKSALNAFVERLNLFQMAVSWGGHESLALPLTVDNHGEDLNLVRMYVGLEDPKDLINDISNSLALL